MHSTFQRLWLFVAAFVGSGSFLAFALSLPSAFASPPALRLATSKSVAPKSPPARPLAAPAKPMKLPAPQAYTLPLPSEVWLQIGPASIPFPGFATETQGTVKASDLLAYPHLSIAKLRPREGQALTWFPAKSLRWKKADDRLKAGEKEPSAAYLSTWLDVGTFATLSLTIRSHQAFRVFVDGEFVGQKDACTTSPKKAVPPPPKTVEAAPKEPNAPKEPRGPTSSALIARSPSPLSPPSPPSPSSRPTSAPAKPLEPVTAKDPRDRLFERMALIVEQQSKLLQQQAQLLETMQGKIVASATKPPMPPPPPLPGSWTKALPLSPGLHQVIVKTLWTPGCVRSWSLYAEGKYTAPPAPSAEAPILASSKPYERYSLDFLLYRKAAPSARISPDGREIAIHFARVKKTGGTEHWTEFRRSSDGSLLHSLRGLGALAELRWSPDGQLASFVTRQGTTATLWKMDRKTRVIRPIREGIAHFGAHRWSPDSRLIVFSAMIPATPTPLEKSGLTRLRGMEDRWPWYRQRWHMYALTADGGMQTRLTAGEWTSADPDWHPSGSKLLFSRTRPDYRQRPFRITDLFELDLQTLRVTKLIADLRWFRSAVYAEDGRSLLILGSPSLFGVLGYDPALPKGALPNEYEGEVYRYHLESKSIECLSKTFHPSIEGLYRHAKALYVTALHTSQVQLYRYDSAKKTFLRVPTPGDIVSSLHFAKKAPWAVFASEGVSQPRAAFVLKTDTKKVSLFSAPAARWRQTLHLGEVKPWTAKAPLGHALAGRVYYPPAFDPRKTYPAIVYYYGGTYPTTRNFDGRYPFHLWAAHGYLVYVVQPSGALGFGQVFSSRHVNEWGSRVAAEIIAATKQFLQAHPFVDPKRLGCIGASYGGFMTMYLISQTRLFSAAISHAGISDIPSYWGGGFWGYLYSSIATAHRYPWSHPEFYRRQSPLFSAHKIHTPLLLLHGAVDTNVPALESYQMYAALRLLKRPVEMVVVAGEDHWILDTKKRVLWTQTIVAWFDRHLKIQGAWWDHLHGKQTH